VIIQIFNPEGTWVYCNEAAADFLGQQREWFHGRNVFVEMPTFMVDWKDALKSVATTRETYIDRSRRGLFASHAPSETAQAWSVLAFPITLHDGDLGVVLTARVLGSSLWPLG
jgi:two-component system OmpR family response regulator